MSGLRKQKDYNWKDSNLALFGSDTEKQVKKESAESEPAWNGAGQEVGLQIWRVEKFKVKHWPKEDYGEFYEGDSYIVLNTYKEEDEIKYDVHFWIGKSSTQDEYGTAAYKTVELDTLLDDKPIQHREVQGHESRLFKSYFKDIMYMKGGCDSGFRHVEKEVYKPRLMKISKQSRNKYLITEEKFRKESLNPDDVFILDLGSSVIQWNGKTSSHFERNEAARIRGNMAHKRDGKATSEAVDEDEGDSNKVIRHLEDQADDDDDDDDNESTEAKDKEPQLFRLTDEGQKDRTMVQKEVAKGKDITKNLFESEDVFILDLKVDSLYVWIGKNTSPFEKQNAMAYATNYLSGTDHPFIAVSVVQEGKEDRDFKTALAA